MPKLVPVSHRELARKLKRAGYLEIRTCRHPVYYLAGRNITIPVPEHPGDEPKGTLRAIVRKIHVARGLQVARLDPEGHGLAGRSFWRRAVLWSRSNAPLPVLAHRVEDGVCPQTCSLRPAVCHGEQHEIFKARLDSDGLTCGAFAS